MRRVLSTLLVALLLVSLLASCGDGKEGVENAAPVPTPAEEENYNTGDASLDNTRNQDGIGPDELLVVSVGTSYNDSRRLTIGAVEEALEAAFPEWSVRRGFTSQIIIDHVKSRDKVSIDNVEEALKRAMDNNVTRLAIQPTHLLDGLEYNELVREAGNYADAFQGLAIGKPLLTSDQDFQTVAAAITKATKAYDDGKTAICFMGHGTTAKSNDVYAKLQQVLEDQGAAHYYVGTVEAAPTVEDVLTRVKAGAYTRVVLMPLMIVAGDHANNDMAGDDADSWKSVFDAAGYEVVCLVQGLGELEEIQALLVEHAQAAIQSLNP